MYFVLFSGFRRTHRPPAPPSHGIGDKRRVWYRKQMKIPCERANLPFWYTKYNILICQVYVVYILYLYWLNYFDIQTKIFWYAMYMLCSYNTYTNNLFCQGHDSAPGLNIMLRKQQHFSVSGQAANPARQHPPVEYVYRHSHPLLQFPPQKSAEWIANNYAAELNVPPRPDPSRPCSTATLNRILHTCIVSE